MTHRRWTAQISIPSGPMEPRGLKLIPPGKCRCDHLDVSRGNGEVSKFLLCQPFLHECQCLLGFIIRNLTSRQDRVPASNSGPTICPAPLIVANVSPLALLVLPTTCPSACHSLNDWLTNASCPLQGILSVQRSLPIQLQIQSYVPT